MGWNFPRSAKDKPRRNTKQNTKNKAERAEIAHGFFYRL
jgi:hypothetical protein